MLRRITSTTLLVWLALAWATVAHAAGVVDPALRFRERRTPHFVIYFHRGEEALAARLALLVEDVRVQVGQALGLEPPALTHVILADQSELANGWATPLPRNIVFLTAAVPPGSSFIGRTDDWLRLVFTHEYTHIVHLDLSRGWSTLARGVFGRSPLAFPNLWLPQWQIEGLATWEESALTGQGRLYAGDFRAIERVAAASGGVERLDRLNGGLVRWPAGHGPYAYGLGFHDYLVRRFGAESLGQLAQATARRLPYFGSRAFRPVFGASLGTLWRDYDRAARAEASQVAEAQETPARRLTTHGQFVAAPRFAPPACDDCPPEIIYSVRNPDTFPELRSIGVDGARDRRLALRYLGDTAGVRGSTLVFDQQEFRRNVGVYSDLYLFDRRTGDLRTLSREQRLIDPDVASDGRIVAVRQAGDRRELVLIPAAAVSAGSSLHSEAIAVIASAPDEQFSAPKWSPNGRAVAVERRTLGALPEIVVVDVDTRAIRVLASDRDARIVTPAWRPDGRAVLAAADFDGGAFDLYEFPLDGGAVTRLTRTSGALWPDVSPDGASIVYAGYTERGFDVFVAAYPEPGSVGTRALVPRIAPPPSPSGVDASQGRGYSPLHTLAPTSWTPLLTDDGVQVRAGALVSGADVLGRHAYAADLSWLVNGPVAPRQPGRTTPDWNVSYAYTRWRPILFASAARQTDFLRTDAEPGTELTTVSQREVQAGVTVPFIHARRAEQVALSVVSSENRFLFPSETRLTRTVATRLSVALRTARVYGYSISPEDGVLIGGTAEVARQALGSAGDTNTATLDVRAYVRGAGRRHVIAVRGSGGISEGTVGTRRAFQLGGVLASPSVTSFASDALGLLRAFPAGAFAGTRVAVANAEYRAPLPRIERGVGTTPIFLRWMHVAAFVDAGRVWSDLRPDPRWKAAWGAELSADVVAGYGLPLTLTAGVAWGRNGAAARGPTFYTRVGRAF